MPEPVVLPDVLRSRLSQHEQNVLLMSTRGGARAVRDLEGVASIEDAERQVAAVKAKAAAVLAETAAAGGKSRHRNGSAAASGTRDCACGEQFVSRNGDHRCEECREASTAKSELRREVERAALEAAGVSAEEPATIAGRTGTDDARPRDAAEPPTQSPVPVPPFDEDDGGPARPLTTLELRAAAMVRRERLVGLLREHGPLSAKRLTIELEASQNTVATDLKRLREGGVVQRTGEVAFDWRGASIGAGSGKGGRASVVWELARDTAPSEPVRVPDPVPDPVVDVQDPVCEAEEPPVPVSDPASLWGEPAALSTAPVGPPPLLDGRARELLNRAAESAREHERIGREVAVLAAEMCEAVPGVLLRERYVAALLRLIEGGETDAALLDRFERLAGLHDD